jgi:uncharacterized phage protein gp47/JayE
VTDYGPTPTGFVRKPLEVILEEIAAAQRATIDPNWNTEADTLAGQYNGIIADQIAQLWEVQEAQYYALSRDADNNALDIIGALTGTARRGATKSTVTLTLSLNASTTVPAGSIVSVLGDPSIRVVTLADAVRGGSPGTVDVDAEAESSGAIRANPLTLTVIETPVAGWTAVTNAGALTGGEGIEDDDTYRRRQLTELAAGGGGSVPGIRADILALGDEIACLVLENDGDTTDADGMPPHSVEAVVLNGEPQAIAEVLFGSKSGGVKTYGNQAPVTVTDDQGIDHDVRFSRPVEVPVYVAIGITTVGDYSGFVGEVTTAIATALVTRSSESYLSIGTDVYAAQIARAALEVSGVLNAQVGLSLSTITDPAAGSLSIAITDRQIATIDGAAISVSEL